MDDHHHLFIHFCLTNSRIIVSCDLPLVSGTATSVYIEQKKHDAAKKNMQACIPYISDIIGYNCSIIEPSDHRTVIQIKLATFFIWKYI